ncbi:MAG: hypothetical protein ACI4IS_05595 [Acutalibacteraceae bacterium]
MERLNAFEKMLSDIQKNYETEKSIMDNLKDEGKDKTATYKQYMGNRLVYSRILLLYKQYGLIE